MVICNILVLSFPTDFHIQIVMHVKVVPPKNIDLVDTIRKIQMGLRLIKCQQPNSSVIYNTKYKGLVCSIKGAAKPVFLVLHDLMLRG